MKHAPSLLLVTCLGALLTGCGSEAVYTEESFATDSPFKLKLNEPASIACESARRSLLGQGYLIDTTSGEQVKGRKAYRRDDSVNTFIEMNVVCASDRKGSTLYANGVLSTYDLKKSGNSASVGISAVGSISLPIGQSADSLVKVAEETIEDKAFYGRFFAAVGHVLKEMEEGPDEGADTAQAAAPKPAPETDIPLEPGPASVPGIVPEPGPAPSAPAAGVPTPVVVPEPGAPAPTAGATPAASGDTTTPSAPGPVQGFSVSAPASLPRAQPAPQPSSPTGAAPQTNTPATTPAPNATSSAAPAPIPTTGSVPPGVPPDAAAPSPDPAPADTLAPTSAPAPATSPAAAPAAGTVAVPASAAPPAPPGTAPAPVAQPAAVPPR